MDKIVKLLRVIPATEVAKRWGVGAENLQEMMSGSESNELTVYISPQKRIRPHDGQVVYFCEGPYYCFFKRYGQYELEKFYFNTDDVEAYESAHPEIVWPVMEEDSVLHLVTGNDCLDDDPFTNTNFTPPPLQEDIPAEQIRSELGMSRLDFVTFLNYGGKHEDFLPTCCEEEFRQYKDSYDHRDGKAPFYTIKMLPTLTVERTDWENWKAKIAKRLTDEDDILSAFNIKSENKEGQLIKRLETHLSDYSRLAPRVTSLESQLAEARAERDRLSESLEAAKARIAELETAATRPQPPSPTLAATQARQEKALDSWLPSVGAMIKVAIMCGAEGTKLRQQPDLNAMFNEMDAELTDRQMKFFRKCLPDDHIDRTGGDKRKA